MKDSGNVFVVFTPIAWQTGALDWIADPSGRTCIVSLVNANDRPFRLQLKAGQEHFAINRIGSSGPRFGAGYDLGLLTQSGGNYYHPCSFELDTVAESDAGLPPLPFAYDKTLLSGVDDGEGKPASFFSLAELECYTLDA